MTGDMYSIMSEKGKSLLREIDHVVFNESQGVPKKLYTFDFHQIDRLVEDENDEADEKNGLNEEKPQRKIGEFILHENFTDEFIEDEGLKEIYKNYSYYEKIFNQDHDFYCCTRNKSEQVDENF